MDDLSKYLDLNSAAARHRSILRSESVAARDGDRTANLAAPNATVTPEIDGFPRNRIRFHIACEECSGTGRWTIDGGNNPYARLYECEACEGAGSARCSECDEVAVDVYSHTSRGQTFSHPVCAAHLAEWQEDEAERVEELDPDRLRDDRDERRRVA